MNFQSYKSYDLILLLLLLLFQSVTPSKIPPKSEDSPFKIALIADVHYAGKGSIDHLHRLTAAIEYINTHSESENILLVGVLGDTAWNPQPMKTAKEELDKLHIPYFILIGDDEMQNGGEEIEFNRIYQPHFQKLEKILSGWRKTKCPVRDPRGRELYLQNYAFDFHGVRIIVNDWNTRVMDPGWTGEQAQLFDFPGGSWDFMKEEVGLAAYSGIKNNILLFSHHSLHMSPFYPIFKKDFGAFSPKEFKVITKFTLGYSDHLGGSFTGHYHLPWHQFVVQGGYSINVVEALHPVLAKYNIFMHPTIMLVQVTPKEGNFKYSYERVKIPYNVTSNA